MDGWMNEQVEKLEKKKSQYTLRFIKATIDYGVTNGLEVHDTCSDQPVGLNLVLSDEGTDGCVKRMIQLMVG